MTPSWGTRVAGFALATFTCGCGTTPEDTGSTGDLSGSSETLPPDVNDGTSDSASPNVDVSPTKPTVGTLDETSSSDVAAETAQSGPPGTELSAEDGTNAVTEPNSDDEQTPSSDVTDLDALGDSETATATSEVGSDAGAGIDISDTSSPGPALTDLSNLVPVPGPFTFVSVGPNDINQAATLLLVEDSGDNSVLVEKFATGFAGDLSPDRRTWLVTTTAANFSSPNLMRIDEAGYVPPVNVPGDVFFMTASPQIKWAADSRFVAGWGAIEDLVEHVGVYDLVAERYLGKAPVTDTGVVHEPVGGLVAYDSDADSSRPAIRRITAAGLSEPLLVPTNHQVVFGERAALFDLDHSTGVVSVAQSLGDEFVQIAAPEAITELIAAPDGEEALAISETGALYAFPADGSEPVPFSSPEPVEGIFSFVAHLGQGLLQSGQVALVDRDSRVVVAVPNLPPSPYAVGGSHFLFEAVEVAFAHVAGGELTLSWPWTHPFISASCRYDRQLNAGIDGRVAAPYDSRDGSFLTLLDLSQAKVELKAELPAPHGGTFSCPVYSLDGETFAIAESSESGSVLYIGDFTGELTEVFTSEQPSMQTYARN